MGHAIRDWRGNEVKEGMTIYFVQTKPMYIGKYGMLIPGGCTKDGKPTEVWESDEDYEIRRNEDIWHLGNPYEVTKKDGRLFASFNEGELTFSTLLSNLVAEPPLTTTIAIKGISDIKPIKNA